MTEMQLLHKKRVRKIPSNITKQGVAKTRLIVPVDRESDGIKEYHLSALKEVGDRMIPAAHGTATRRNLEGRLIVHRDKPKEFHSWLALWGRNQFCGRGETEWVENYVTRTGLRYPRTQLPAEEIELSLIENTEGQQFFATDLISTSDEERWLTAANLMLEIFEYAWIAESRDLQTPLTVTRRVNWRFLPPGEHDWDTVRPEFEEVIETLESSTAKHRAKRSIKRLYDFGPDQVVMGLGGFHGYFAFCFSDQEFTILESIHPNNATYILGQNWEGISQLTKAEILEAQLHLRRLIHDQFWDAEIENWFSNHAA